MATNIDGAKLQKCNVNSAKCKKINVNGVKVWSAAPDFLYDNGAVDGEYLKTMIGSNSWNDNGYGFRSNDFSLNANGNIRLGAGASSGYGNTYSCENKAMSNLMDLSGATHLKFIGSMTCSGAYQYNHWAGIELIDNSGNSATIVSLTQTALTQAESITQPINQNVQINNLGLDLSKVKLQLRYGYSHHAPWSNWYGGGGELNISSIPVTS